MHIYVQEMKGIGSQEWTKDVSKYINGKYMQELSGNYKTEKYNIQSKH